MSVDVPLLHQATTTNKYGSNGSAQRREENDDGIFVFHRQPERHCHCAVCLGFTRDRRDAAVPLFQEAPKRGSRGRAGEERDNDLSAAAATTPNMMSRQGTALSSTGFGGNGATSSFEGGDDENGPAADPDSLFFIPFRLHPYDLAAAPNAAGSGTLGLQLTASCTALTNVHVLELVLLYLPMSCRSLLSARLVSKGWNFFVNLLPHWIYLLPLRAQVPAIAAVAGWNQRAQLRGAARQVEEMPYERLSSSSGAGGGGRREGEEGTRGPAEISPGAAIAWPSDETVRPTTVLPPPPLHALELPDLKAIAERIKDPWKRQKEEEEDPAKEEAKNWKGANNEEDEEEDDKHRRREAIKHGTAWNTRPEDDDEDPYEDERRAGFFFPVDPTLHLSVGPNRVFHQGVFSGKGKDVPPRIDLEDRNDFLKSGWTMVKHAAWGAAAWSHAVEACPEDDWTTFDTADGGRWVLPSTQRTDHLRPTVLETIQESNKNGEAPMTRDAFIQRHGDYRSFVALALATKDQRYGVTSSSTLVFRTMRPLLLTREEAQLAWRERFYFRRLDQFFDAVTDTQAKAHRETNRVKRNVFILCVVAAVGFVVGYGLYALLFYSLLD